MNEKELNQDIKILKNNKVKNNPKLENNLNLSQIMSSLKDLKNTKIENIFQKYNNNEKKEQDKIIKEDKKERIIELMDGKLNISNNENFKSEEEDETFSDISNNSNSSSSIMSFKKYKSKRGGKLELKNVINYRGNKRTIIKRKKYYIYQLLQRWWYALPKWPPDDYDTKELLTKNKLRLVEGKNWKKETDINSDDFQKCIELPGYKYVYFTKDGKIFDFRPEKGKPSFNNLMKLNNIEIHQHLVNALKKQLEELEKRNNINELKLIKQISNQLKIEKLNLKHIQNTQNT